MKFRRRVPRVTTEAWPARYIDQGDPGSGLRDCRVVDVSLLGVGLEVFGDVEEDVVGHKIEIYLPAPMGESVTLRLVGRVEHVSEGRLGGARAGVRFESLSETEQHVLKVLALLKVAW